MTYPWLDIAYKDLGVHETSGPKVTPEILVALDWADGVKDGKYLQGIHDDETPWCSSWACSVMEQSGHKSPRSAWAQSWAAWDQKLNGPAVGCIVVFKWSPSAGHVGYVVGKTPSGALAVLGGNQSDAVTISGFGTGNVLAYRWPTGVELPKDVGTKSLPVVQTRTKPLSPSETR